MAKLIKGSKKSRKEWLENFDKSENNLLSVSEGETENLSSNRRADVSEYKVNEIIFQFERLFKTNLSKEQFFWLYEQFGDLSNNILSSQQKENHRRGEKDTFVKNKASVQEKRFITEYEKWREAFFKNQLENDGLFKFLLKNQPTDETDWGYLKSFFNENSNLLIEISNFSLSHQNEKIKELLFLNEKTEEILNSLNEINPSFRIAMTDCIANICSSKFEGFSFISPFKYIKVNPEYHEVIQGIGTRILMANSFIIIREPSKQVFYKSKVTTF